MKSEPFAIRAASSPSQGPLKPTRDGTYTARGRSALPVRPGGQRAIAGWMLWYESELCQTRRWKERARRHRHLCHRRETDGRLRLRSYAERKAALRREWRRTLCGSGTGHVLLTHNCEATDMVDGTMDCFHRSNMFAGRSIFRVRVSDGPRPSDARFHLSAGDALRNSRP